MRKELARQFQQNANNTPSESVDAIWRRYYQKYLSALAIERQRVIDSIPDCRAKLDLLADLEPQPWERFEAVLSKLANKPERFQEFVSNLEESGTGIV